MQGRNPDLHKAVEFRKTPAFGLIFLAHQMFEYGEAHSQSFFVDLQDSWSIYQRFMLRRIKQGSDGVQAGTDAVAVVKEEMGYLWPTKGFFERKLYDECKAALDEARDCIVEQLTEAPEERVEYMGYWPFD
ncbi:phosphotransferase enzyme family protein [Penicillium herquei]|nr:phosphotransferase enzyme family protein [Penicillium herquei]